MAEVTPSRDAPSRHDVVIVGAGLAGLAAAWTLRDRDTVVLEAEQRLGGRVRSVRHGAYWFNLGAHLLAGPEMATPRLAADFGIETVTPRGLIAAVGMRGHVVRASRAESLPFRLPMPMAARLSLARAGLQLRRDERRVTSLDRSALLRATDPAAWESLVVDRRLEAISFARYLGSVHPDVRALFRVVANRGAGELEDTSADYGISSFVGAFRHPRANVVGGTEELVKGLVGRLPRPPIVGARVVGVQQDAAGVTVSYRDSDGEQVVRAATAVVATPAPIARRIVGDLPPAKDEALAKVRYAPFVVAGLTTNERDAMPWDDLYAVAVADASFCMFFNPASAVRTSQARATGGTLVMYAAGERARPLLQEPDERIRDRYLNDLDRLFPTLRPIVDDVVIAKWEFGGPTPFPMRSQIQRDLVAPHGRVAFAGDYLQYSGLDSAFQSGVRAARLVDAMLGPSS